MEKSVLMEDVLLSWTSFLGIPKEVMKIIIAEIVCEESVPSIGHTWMKREKASTTTTNKSVSHQLSIWEVTCSQFEPYEKERVLLLPIFHWEWCCEVFWFVCFFYNSSNSSILQFVPISTIKANKKIVSGEWEPCQNPDDPTICVHGQHWKLQWRNFAINKSGSMNVYFCDQLNVFLHQKPIFQTDLRTPAGIWISVLLHILWTFRPLIITNEQYSKLNHFLDSPGCYHIPMCQLSMSLSCLVRVRQKRMV